MNDVLEAIANVLPLTYSIDALFEIAVNQEATSELWTDIAVVGGVIVVVLALASLTLRRQTA